jgi:hypothetical protein
MMMNDQSVSWAAMRRGKRLAKDKELTTAYSKTHRILGEKKA